MHLVVPFFSKPPSFLRCVNIFYFLLFSSPYSPIRGPIRLGRGVNDSRGRLDYWSCNRAARSEEGRGWMEWVLDIAKGRQDRTAQERFGQIKTAQHRTG